MNKYKYNVNKNTIEKYGQFFAYVNVIDANRIVKLLNKQDKQIGELKNICKTINDYKNYEKEYQKRIKKLEEGILNCLFDNKPIGQLAEEMELVE